MTVTVLGGLLSSTLLNLVPPALAQRYVTRDRLLVPGKPRMQPARS
jgi:hypothetical protein